MNNKPAFDPQVIWDEYITNSDEEESLKTLSAEYKMSYEEIDDMFWYVLPIVGATYDVDMKGSITKDEYRFGDAARPVVTNYATRPVSIYSFLPEYVVFCHRLKHNQGEN